MGHMSEHFEVEQDPDGRWTATLPAHHDSVHTHDDALPRVITRATFEEAFAVAEFLSGVEAS